MWSDRYNYYSIQSDITFSEKTNSEKVIQVLLTINYLVKISHQSFENTKDFPWLNLAITMTKNGNFSIYDKPLEYVNQITIVCSKDEPQSVYTDLFLSIAEKLNWKLFLEEDDHGYENVEITH